MIAIHGQNSRRAGGPLMSEAISTAAQMSLRLNLSAAVDLISGEAKAVLAAAAAASP